MSTHVIAHQDELSDGERITVQIDGREISVFNVQGEYYAYTNWCPHQSGPVCEGKLAGYRSATYHERTGEVEFEWSRDGEILSCPWHGWEFDIMSGENFTSDAKLLSHPVEEKDGEIVITL